MSMAHKGKHKPDYRFVIKGEIAEGELPDGTRFCIDTDMVEPVSQRYWHIEKGRYIIESGSKPKRKLHSFILGLDGNHDSIVDHINRDKTDNRRTNLRFVSPQQNAMNKSLQRNNQTGYVGVCFDTSRNMYISVIGLGNRRIRLLRSHDPIECAQAYNIASNILFGDYCGYQNDVPEPPGYLTHRIEYKCLPYVAEANLATQPCGLF